MTTASVAVSLLGTFVAAQVSDSAIKVSDVLNLFLIFELILVADIVQPTWKKNNR
jgi:hypothetical protein